MTRAVQQIADTLQNGVRSLRVPHCVRRFLEDAGFHTRPRLHEGRVRRQLGRVLRPHDLLGREDSLARVPIAVYTIISTAGIGPPCLISSYSWSTLLATSIR